LGGAGQPHGLARAGHYWGRARTASRSSSSWASAAGLATLLDLASWAGRTRAAMEQGARQQRGKACGLGGYGQPHGLAGTRKLGLGWTCAPAAGDGTRRRGAGYALGRTKKKKRKRTRQRGKERTIFCVTGGSGG
jgi:hypothetical protein